MAVLGLLVKEWPLTLAVDAAGIVVKAGSKAVGPLGPFKEGDEVCGCSRLGEIGHGTCQEYYLMDAAVTIPKPKNISLAEAAGVGVGFEVDEALG
jgi:NADPH:quinone reductase-like Zn-dependent oxidoreductase